MMEVTVETLRTLLVQTGCDPAVAAAVRPDVPLAELGVGAGLAAAFARELEERFGAPIGDAAAPTPGSLQDWAAFLAAAVDDETAKRAAISRIKAGWREIPPGQSYELDMLRPEDAPGVAQLFYTIYGDTYPVIGYYIPEQLIELNRQGRVLTVVARLDSGIIAGQGAYFQSSPPNKAVFEQGQLLVAPEYRNSFMAYKILNRLDALSRTMDQAEAFFGEAVCTHLVTQKSVSKQGFSECGLELALMPAGTYEKEGASGRVSCLLAARVDRDRALPLFLPQCYRDVLERILSGFSLDRAVCFAAADEPVAAACVLESAVFDFAQVMRVQVATVGRNFPACLEELDAKARVDGLAVLQVYVNAGAPGVVFAVEALREKGFVFGGLLPRWFGTDGIMLQKLYVAPDFASVNLFSDLGKTIFSCVRADWDRSQGRR
jgi:hypothetical protein